MQSGVLTSDAAGNFPTYNASGVGFLIVPWVPTNSRHPVNNGGAATYPITVSVRGMAGAGGSALTLDAPRSVYVPEPFSSIQITTLAQCPANASFLIYIFSQGEGVGTPSTAFPQIITKTDTITFSPITNQPYFGFDWAKVGLDLTGVGAFRCVLDASRGWVITGGTCTLWVWDPWSTDMWTDHSDTGADELPPPPLALAGSTNADGSPTYAGQTSGPGGWPWAPNGSLTFPVGGRGARFEALPDLVVEVPVGRVLCDCSQVTVGVNGSSSGGTNGIGTVFWRARLRA